MLSWRVAHSALQVHTLRTHTRLETDVTRQLPSTFASQQALSPGALHVRSFAALQASSALHDELFMSVCQHTNRPVLRKRIATA